MAADGYFGIIGADAADLITYQIQFNNDNTYLIRDGAGLINGGDEYPTDEWIHVRVNYDVDNQSYDLLFNDEIVNEGMGLQVADAINTQFLIIAYSGADVAIDHAYVDDIEVRRREREEGFMRFLNPENNNRQNAVSINDVLRAGPVR